MSSLLVGDQTNLICSTISLITRRIILKINVSDTRTKTFGCRLVFEDRAHQRCLGVLYCYVSFELKIGRDFQLERIALFLSPNYIQKYFQPTSTYFLRHSSITRYYIWSFKRQLTGGSKFKFKKKNTKAASNIIVCLFLNF